MAGGCVVFEPQVTLLYTSPPAVLAGMRGSLRKKCAFRLLALRGCRRPGGHIFYPNMGLGGGGGPGEGVTLLYTSPPAVLAGMRGSLRKKCAFRLLALRGCRRPGGHIFYPNMGLGGGGHRRVFKKYFVSGGGQVRVGCGADLRGPGQE